MEVQPAIDMVNKYKGTIVGIKSAHFTGPEWTPYINAEEIGKATHIPVMVDFATFRAERPFQDLVLKKLRPGDIYTHTYLIAVPMFDGEGRLLPYLLEARERGIIFDVGHGGGSFAWKIAVPAVKEGLIADSISTDLHVDSMNSGMKDLLNVMSKYLALGLTADQVILRATWNPARCRRSETSERMSSSSSAHSTSGPPVTWPPAIRR